MAQQAALAVIHDDQGYDIWAELKEVERKKLYVWYWDIAVPKLYKDEAVVKAAIARHHSFADIASIDPNGKITPNGLRWAAVEARRNHPELMQMPNRTDIIMQFGKFE